MHRYRSLVSLVAAVIVLVSLLTGPSLGLIAVPSDEPTELGTGSATLAVESMPDSATLRADSYTDVHRLDVSPPVLSVSDVDGSPLITVSITVDRLDFSQGSVYTLEPGMDGHHSFPIRRTSIDSAEIDAEAYAGRVRVVLRDESGRTVLAERNVTVEVTE
jgi:hypothetical protein